MQLHINDSKRFYASTQLSKTALNSVFAALQPCGNASKDVFYRKYGEKVVKIDKAYLYNMRNDVHFQFHTGFKYLVERNGAESLKIKPMFDTYQLLYDKEDIALKKVVKSAITAKIQEAGKARNAVYAGMVGTIAAAQKHFNDDVRRSATQLKIIFDAYGNATRKSQMEVTTVISNLLQELQGKYATDVATVGVAQWVAELDVRNNAFDALVRERFDEAAAKPDIVLRDARKELDSAYLAICERLSALILIEGIADYEVFIKSLNVGIAKFNASIHHKGARTKELDQATNPQTKEVHNEQTTATTTDNPNHGGSI